MNDPVRHRLSLRRSVWQIPFAKSCYEKIIFQIIESIYHSAE
jgi:hypothetical protein